MANSWIIGDFATGQGQWDVISPGSGSTWKASVSGGSGTLSLMPTVAYQRQLGTQLRAGLGHQFFAAVINEAGLVEFAGTVGSCKASDDGWDFDIAPIEDYFAKRVVVNSHDQQIASMRKPPTYVLKGTWQQIASTAITYTRNRDVNAPFDFRPSSGDTRTHELKIETVNLKSLADVLSDIADQGGVETTVIPEWSGRLPSGRISWHVRAGLTDLPLVVPSSAAWPMDMSAPTPSRRVDSWDSDGTTIATHAWVSGGKSGADGKPFVSLVANPAATVPKGMVQVDLVDTSAAIESASEATWKATSLCRDNAAPTETCEMTISPHGIPDPDLIRVGDLVDLQAGDFHPIVPPGRHQMRVMTKKRTDDGATSLSLTQLAPMVASRYRDYFA